MKQDIRLTMRVFIDPEPDERCNVLAVAVIDGGPMVALMFNAN